MKSTRLLIGELIKIIACREYVAMSKRDQLIIQMR